jgi:hypothetical protein
LWSPTNLQTPAVSPTQILCHPYLLAGMTLLDKRAVQSAKPAGIFFVAVQQQITRVIPNPNTAKAWAAVNALAAPT